MALDLKALRVDLMPAPAPNLTLTIRGTRYLTADDLAKVQDRIRSAYRAQRVTIRETDPSRREYEIAIMRADPLAAKLQLAAAPEVAHDLSTVPLGVAETGADISLHLANEPGMIVGGVPGSGKTASLAAPLAALCRSEHVQIAVVDGKEGDDLAWLAPRSWRFISKDQTLENVRDLTAELVELMRRRVAAARDLVGQSNLWNASPHPALPLVVLVMDECQSYLDRASLLSKEDKAVGAEITANVAALIRKGRSARMLTILTTQKPTADSIPTAIRDNASNRICFAVTSPEAAEAVLGSGVRQSDTRPDRLQLPRDVGVCVVEDGQGDYTRVRVPYAPPELLDRVGRETAHLTADPTALLADAVAVKEVPDAIEA